MQQEVTSKSIDGITDLVVVAPIREDFIRAYENVTYDTRLRLVAEALHKIRVTAREYELAVPFADTTERILTLLDFRIGVLDDHVYQVTKDGLGPRRFLYLAATFDGAWEPYMRLIWNPLGPFLDLLFCNCEGYVTAGDHSFAEYTAWVRKHQVDSAIFYATTGTTVKDAIYLSKLEALQRSKADNDFDLARATGDNPDAQALAVREAALQAAQAGDQGPLLTLNQMALEALTVLYRLADYYPPDRLIITSDDPIAEGRYLLRVTRSLLTGWNSRLLPDAVRKIYREPLQWFESPAPLDSTAQSAPDPKPDWAEIQGGMFSDYGSAVRPVTHGALLLMGIDDPKPAQMCLAQLSKSLHFELDSQPADGVYRNIAFTKSGLERIGFPKWLVQRFPKEFREGMAERSGLLGDMRENHPRRWTLPARHRPKIAPQSSQLPPVELDEVDFLINLRVAPGPDADGAKLLTAAIDNILASLDGVVLLSIEDMMARGVNALGFVDGISQPVPQPGPVPHVPSRDDVPLGELLYGYANSRGDVSDRRLHTDPRRRRECALLFNASFLAVRKIKLDVPLFEQFLKDEALRLTAALGRPFSADDLASRLMGRHRDGRPLIYPEQGAHNQFDYSNDDPTGDKCPLASHIRRTNPRNRVLGRPNPRLMRRGMSYGPAAAEGGPAAERGILFMAYMSSIAEQYEVVQRWINGGNSTDIASGNNDPLFGVDPKQGPRVFRFLVDGKTMRVPIPKSFAAVQWGAYFYVPSRTALDAICTTEQASEHEELRETVGQELIDRLGHLNEKEQQLEWKRILEDFDTKDPAEQRLSPDVWSAIRYFHHGALRLDKGVQLYDLALPTFPSDPHTTNGQPVVLVGSLPLVEEVLSNWEVFSVEEQLKRVNMASGSIYVAQQPDNSYDDPSLQSDYGGEAYPTNEILMSVGMEEGFVVGYKVGAEVLARARAVATNLRQSYFEIELRREYLMPALAALCEQWFGIPDGKNFVAGGWNWDRQGEPTPRCPGDFLSPSRFAFYPRPTSTVADYGRLHGQAILDAGKQFVADCRDGGTVSGSVASRMFKEIDDSDVLARNLIGIMVGALPPMDGCLRGILYEWLRERSLWRHQASLHRKAGAGGSNPRAALDALLPAMSKAIRKRPAPDLLYRTARRRYTLQRFDKHGNPDPLYIEPNDLVILGLVSASQWYEDLFVVFGGDRRKPGHPVHACPAYNMAMGGMAGILAALLDSGQIQALPASLIIRVTLLKP